MCFIFTSNNLFAKDEPLDNATTKANLKVLENFWDNIAKDNNNEPCTPLHWNRYKSANALRKYFKKRKVDIFKSNIGELFVYIITNINKKSVMDYFTRNMQKDKKEYFIKQANVYRSYIKRSSQEVYNNMNNSDAEKFNKSIKLFNSKIVKEKTKMAHRYINSIYTNISDMIDHDYYCYNQLK